MDFTSDRFSRHRLTAWVLFIATCIVGLVVFQHATRWRGGAGEHDNSAPMRLMSQAQSARCLTAQGLHVTSAGTRRLHVTGPWHIALTLTFFPTFDEAQAAMTRSERQGARMVTRDGVRGGAMDTVAWRSRFVLENQEFRQFSSCVGHQPS